MNAQQRRRSKRLKLAEAKKIWIKETCPRCKQPGLHWVETTKTWPAPPFLQLTQTGQGFWVCEDLYGPDGWRKEEDFDCGMLQPVFLGVAFAGIQTWAREGRG